MQKRKQRTQVNLDAADVAIPKRHSDGAHRATGPMVLCALILGLALFLRVRGLEATKIWSDQAFTLNTAMRWVNGGPMPLASNKSSIGTINPPMIEYLYALALRIWSDVLSVSALTLVSGMVAVAAAGWGTYKVFGRRAALWTMLIFAVNPWSVFYSQLIWNQTMVPVFSALTLVCLMLYFAADEGGIYLFLSFLWASCMTQVHPGSSVQLLTMGVVFALFWRKLRVWPLLLGVSLFILTYVPYLMYENAMGWADVKAMLELAGEPAPISAASVLLSVDWLHARGLLDSAAYLTQFDRLATVLLAFSLLYALWAGARFFSRRHRDPQAARKAAGFGIMLLWFVFPILMYLRSAHYLQIFYLVSQLPVHFILIGVCLDRLQEALARRARHIRRPEARRAVRLAAWGVLPLPLLALVGWQFAFNLRFQDARFRAEGPTQVRHLHSAIQTTRRLLTERPEGVLVVVSLGHNLERSDLAPLREFTFPERVLFTDGRLAVPVPAPCAVYLDALPGSRASTWLADTAVPLPDATLSVSGKRWRFYDLCAAARADWAEEGASRAPLARWENGVALTRYRRGPILPGAALPLTLTWSVEADAAEMVYHIGTYLLTAGDQVVAQSDGPGFDSIQWRKGDQFVTWFEIPVPMDLAPDTYRTAVAQYTWPELDRVDLRSGDNTAILEQFALPAP